MKIAAIVQGSSLAVYLGLAEHLEATGTARTVGLVVSDAAVFRSHAGHPVLARSDVPILKEWKLYASARPWPAGAMNVSDYERETGEPIWHALMADRRLFFGRYSKRLQAYAPRFSEAQQLSLAAAAIAELSLFLDSTAPDVLLSFGTATLLDYIAARLARARGIRFRQLKSTKIANYVCLTDDIFSLSSHVARSYDTGRVSENGRAVARSYMERVRSSGMIYEGAIDLGKRLHGFSARESLVRVGRALALEARHRARPEERRDAHLDGYVIPALIESFVQPWRYSAFRKEFGSSFWSADALSQSERFAFMPLHFEPEVSLQIFGRPYQNQIEVVRNVAMSLPAGTPLVVKEHPRALGFRPIGYYRKLARIPNVRFADPLLPSIGCVRHSALTVVISGTIGLEAAILGKPVALLGRPNYAALPRENVTLVEDPWTLPQLLKSLLEREQAPDTTAIETLLAATIDGSVPVDLYSGLLGKKGRHRGTAAENMPDIPGMFVALAEYTRARLSQEEPVEEGAE